MSSLGPLDVGARVSVRRRVDGALTDVVGDLEMLDDVALAVRSSSGALVTIARADVAAARTVGASPREAFELEGVTARGWPAPDSRWLGRWWLRAADGFTARANSVRPLGPPGLPLDDALVQVRAWYRERNLPPRVQVVVGSSLDRGLAHRGWPAAPEVSVLTTTLARATSRSPAVGATSVHVSGTASSAWLSLFRGGDTPPVARAVLEGPPVVGFAIRSDDAGASVAIGRAAVEPPWVGLTAIEVAPAARRLGHGRAVMAGLLRWASERGALRVCLEVHPTNEPAVALYRSLGFTEHHRHAGREAP